MSETKAYYLGVDVGTGSVRAALVSDQGKVVRVAKRPITVHNPKPNFYQQSSSEIWTKAETCMREVLQALPKESARVAGIGFDATCSLVVLDDQFQGLSVDPDEQDSKWDIIMWMDHRAAKEAEEINATEHRVLDFVGGKISLEMQTPKLLWLKRHCPDKWAKAKHFYDLSDFMSARACDFKSLSRSLCSTVCKWTYEVRGGEMGWSKDFFDTIHLGDLAENNFAKLGSDIVSPGRKIGSLNPTTMEIIGLSSSADVSVSSSLIDAHAGALGMLTCALDPTAPEKQLGLICGTSACHMVLTRSAIRVPGVWGPYFSAVLPKYWLLEGGQTAVGSLIDHVLETHPAYESAKEEAEKSRFSSVMAYLESHLSQIQEARDLPTVAHVTSKLHMWPDYHGNRAPLADPHMTGMLTGLTLDASVTSLAMLYLSTVQAMAYGTRAIVEQIAQYAENESHIHQAVICGGLAQSDLFIQTQADVLGIKVLRPSEPEAVLLGAAMLGAATDVLKYPEGLPDVLQSLRGTAKVYEPNPKVKSYHNKKYRVFQEMGKDQMKYRDIMEEGNL